MSPVGDNTLNFIVGNESLLICKPPLSESDTSRYVLAVSVENGCILLLKHHDDVSPIRISTGLSPLHLEWSNCRQLLSVAGSRAANTSAATQEYTNVVRVYTDTGVLLYSALIPYTQVLNHNTSQVS